MAKIAYDYYVHTIVDGDIMAYKAILPAFNNTVVYGQGLQELEDGIQFTIQEEIKELKEAGKPVPPPDTGVKASGRILLRIDPALHERLALEAKANKKSLNKYLEEKLS